jgi:hypothetical protein
MLAMPSNKLHMGAISLARRHQDAPGRIDNRANAVRIIGLARHHDLHIVTQPDKAAIELSVVRTFGTSRGLN